ncbi:MAG TPA: hypothetical protein VJQ08_09440 [Candidatus Dormibacteraeota bacterium]|nr:hypothetical protein [Candidatus Dormibacteraeota bacterium]
MPPESILLSAFAALTLAFALVFAPRAVSRRSLAVRGGVGLGAIIAIAVVPNLDLALLVLLAIGVVDAASAGARGFGARLRAPVLAVGLLTLAGLLARAEGPDVLARFAAVGLGAGLAAAVGVMPYLHPVEPDRSQPWSSTAWLAFIGPVLAVVLVARGENLLGPDAGGVFGAILIGIGLLNVAWGGVAAWLTDDVDAAWRYSFIADWGLVLCGLGLTIVDGRRAALLLLFTIVVGRLPLYVASRLAGREKTVTERPINLVVAASLAGAAPFAGFAARILLLRSATQLAWPLALVLALGMLLWLPGSYRLGQSLGLPRGRTAAGILIVLALNIVVGLYPLPILGVARL